MSDQSASLDKEAARIERLKRLSQRNRKGRAMKKKAVTAKHGAGSGTGLVSPR